MIIFNAELKIELRKKLVRICNEIISEIFDSFAKLKKKNH